METIHNTYTPSTMYIDFNTLSDFGLIWKINLKILHPLGLALTREPHSGISLGAIVSKDFHWEYTSELNEKNKKKFDFFLKHRKEMITLRAKNFKESFFRDFLIYFSLQLNEEFFKNRIKEFCVDFKTNIITITTDPKYFNPKNDYKILCKIVGDFDLEVFPSNDLFVYQIRIP